jgi:transposase
MGKGFDGLALIVQETLRRSAFRPPLRLSRPPRVLVKCLWNGGLRLCLFSSVWSEGGFCGLPVTISTAQLSYLLSDIDWRMPQETWRPMAVR